MRRLPYPDNGNLIRIGNSNSSLRIRRVSSSSSAKFPPDYFIIIRSPGNWSPWLLFRLPFLLPRRRRQHPLIRCNDISSSSSTPPRRLFVLHRRNLSLFPSPMLTSMITSIPKMIPFTIPLLWPLLPKIIIIIIIWMMVFSITTTAKKKTPRRRPLTTDNASSDRKKKKKKPVVVAALREDDEETFSNRNDQVNEYECYT